MTKNKIADTINELINDKFNINIMHNGLSDRHFFGNDIGLHARDLVFILYESERIYSLKLNEDEITSEQFYSLNGLSELISNKLHEG